MPEINRFSSRRRRLDHAFLANRLQGAKSYIRIAGYFRSSIFELVGEEIAGIPDVRIVCNSELDAADVRAVWADAVAAPTWAGPPVWVHGDLHPANVVVADGTLAGVVDFGALFAGDPAWDLAAAWLLLPAGAAARFFAAYAPVDEPTVRRARGFAALKSLFLMLMGQNGDRGLPGGKPAWGPVGRAALDRVLSERLTRFHE